jgi:hypothetical protein
VMVDGIPPSLRGSVDVFVASRGIPTLALVSSMWKMLWHSHCIFCFGENPLDIELGLGWGFTPMWRNKQF